MRKRCILISICLALLIVSGCGTTSSVDLMANVHAAEKPAKPVEPDSVFVDSVGAFSWALFQEAAKEKENTLISPASVYFALAMTMNGAGGTTRDAMLKTLSAEKLSVGSLNIACRDWMTLLMNTGDKTDLKISNSIWYNDGFSVDPGFLKTNADFYAAALRRLDFADSNAAKLINDWVRTSTEGKINSIMDKTDESDLMYLINAVYFKSMWKNQFASLQTYPGEFFLEEGTVAASFMKRDGDTAFLTDQERQGVLLPFMDTRFAFFAILPVKGNNARDTAAQMNAATFKNLLKSSRQTNLSLHLPKFEVEYATSLLEHLTSLGMGEAFHSRADFSLMDKNRNKALSVTGVGHKTYFKIDESGVEAAAVTGVTMAGSIKAEEKRKLIFDRPFLYGIIDSVTGLPLFIGIMDNPGKE